MTFWTGGCGTTAKSGYILVVIRTIMRIQQFLWDFFHCGMEATQRILLLIQEVGDEFLRHILTDVMSRFSNKPFSISVLLSITLPVQQF